MNRRGRTPCAPTTASSRRVSSFTSRFEGRPKRIPVGKSVSIPLASLDSRRHESRGSARPGIQRGLSSTSMPSAMNPAGPFRDFIEHAARCLPFQPEQIARALTTSTTPSLSRRLAAPIRLAGRQEGPGSRRAALGAHPQSRAGTSSVRSRSTVAVASDTRDFLTACTPRPKIGSAIRPAQATPNNLALYEGRGGSRTHYPRLRRGSAPDHQAFPRAPQGCGIVRFDYDIRFQPVPRQSQRNPEILLHPCYRRPGLWACGFAT